MAGDVHRRHAPVTACLLFMLKGEHTWANGLALEAGTLTDQLHSRVAGTCRRRAIPITDQVLTRGDVIERNANEYPARRESAGVIAHDHIAVTCGDSLE